MSNVKSVTKDGTTTISDLTPEEESDLLLFQESAAEVVLGDWQNKMDAHDAKWTLRMTEDQTNLMLGLITLQELRDAANVGQIPLEWWIEEKARIRENK